MRSTSVRFQRLCDFGKFTGWFWEINLYYFGRWQVLCIYDATVGSSLFLLTCIHWYWLVTNTTRKVTNVLTMKNWTTSSTGVVGVRRNRKDKSRSESFLHVKVASEPASGQVAVGWNNGSKRSGGAMKSTAALEPGVLGQGHGALTSRPRTTDSPN